jgi:xanthine dehydrogenase D subunit
MSVDATTDRPSSVRGPRVGESAPRPDGPPKVQGRFAFSSDLVAEGMLWGHTLRSPHPRARIVSIDVSAALAVPGVHAVLTADDVPGRNAYGLEKPDQPVLAVDEVRYVGEPVAVVAADHPRTAELAAGRIEVVYEPLDPVVDPEAAIAGPPIHPDGNLFRELVIRHGDQRAGEAARAVGAVSVEGTYHVAMQDQAPLGTEAGLAVPSEDGGVELFISTQWLHVDRAQVAAALGLDEERVRLTLAGVGGAFGAREDCSLQVHLCLLALHTGRPVKMVYDRAESFVGHVHRHPATMWYRHTADADGTLISVEARLVFDGGAYLSSSLAVIGNAACFAVGPYRTASATIEALAVRTNNPPCGAMRGFGAVQTCFAHEAQMDKLAAALGMDPIELRLRNVLRAGDRIITGQVLTGATPVEEVLRSCASDDREIPEPDDPMLLPGGAGRTTRRGNVRRGVGVALGFKNLMFSEGFDDDATARVRVHDGVATVTTACAEVGQGFVTLAQQIVREALGVEDVVLAPADTSIGSAGSTSASRQTMMSGGAVLAAAERVAQQLRAAAAEELGVDVEEVALVDGRLVGPGLDRSIAEATVVAVEAEVTHRHAPTEPLDEDGQGDAHVSFAYSAHRAVVDVDVELGLVRLVDLSTSQDVGRVMNPLQLRGQLEGGAAQGAGLALMEEIVVDGGRIRNPSFTDYLIPTALDLPTLSISALVEQPEPGAPFGAKGAGEPPTISSTPAIVAAIRNATGLELPRTPVRPQDIALAGTIEP